VSYEKEVDIGNKLNNYMKITDIKNNAMTPQKPLKQRRGNLYNTLALPVLLDGSENRTIQARDARRITAAEIKYMRKTAEYTGTDYKTNTDCERTKYNPGFGQNARLQKTLAASYKTECLIVDY
jgi:hypothetical protein